jgi:palmitoyltransferase ZDHHC13/17
VLLISFTVASVKDPGYVKPTLPFQKMVEELHPSELCADCQVIRTPRSKHCAICNKCVERFDHHCPWLNSCVGIHNHNAFLIFISSLLLILLCTTASSLLTLIDECHPRATEECVMQHICLGCKNIPLRYAVLAFTIIVSLFFGVPATALFYIHIKNYSAGQTTNERFAKKRTTSMTSSEIASDDNTAQDLKKRRRSCWLNCKRMWCERTVPAQEELYEQLMNDQSNYDSLDQSYQDIK